MGESTPYKSGQPSVINNQHVSARRGAVNAPLQVLADPPALPNDTSTDRYYREGGSYRGPVKLVDIGQVMLPSQAAPAAPEPGVAKCLQLRDKGHVGTVRDNTVQLLNAGATGVIIQCADEDLLGRARVALDLATARQQITHAQLRDVRFERIATPAELAAQVGSAVPTHTVAVPQAEPKLSLEQMRAMVAGTQNLKDALAAEDAEAPGEAPARAQAIADMLAEDAASEAASATPAAPAVPDDTDDLPDEEV